MLTVLWRKADGAERIFPAHQIERLQAKGEQCVPAKGDRFKIWSDDGELPGPFEITLEAPFGALFVMNRDGQTVARYLVEGPLPVTKKPKNPYAVAGGSARDTLNEILSSDA